LGSRSIPASSVSDTSDGTRRFSERAENYARYRPGYPDALIDTLEREIGLSSSTVVADVGAGTGLSSEPFLRLGCTVFAIEPNDEMRTAAEDRLGDLPGFHAVAARAEDTGLPDDSVDLIVAGQSFHWFDGEAALPELRRILRPGGHVALFWNSRRTDTTFNEECEQLVARFAIDDRHRKCRRGEEDDVSWFFEGEPLRFRFPNHQTFDLASLRGRMLSSSYAPLPGHPGHEPMLEALGALFDRHAVDGRVRFEYETELYVGRPREAAAAS
jgi:SAM-dependent methyltransferase